jgi:chromosome segregation ATPase
MQSADANERVDVDPVLGDRVDALATWVTDIDGRLRAAELATGDEKTAKELRKAIEALSKHDPKLEKRVTDRVDVLGDRLATLASTVSTTAATLAGKDGEIAGLRRELEEVEKRIEGVVRDLGRGVDPKEINKLRSAVETLSAQRPARAPDSRIEALNGKVLFLTERVDTLATTVATTASGLAGREGDMAALRHRLDEATAAIASMTKELRRLERDESLPARLEELQAAVARTGQGLAAREQETAALRERIDEAYSRVGTAVSDLQQSLGGLSAQVTALETLPQATAAAIDGRTAELNERIDGLGGRLEAVANEVGAALRGLADRDSELATLHGEVETTRTHVDGIVSELRAALAALPEPGAVDAKLEARLAGLTGAVTVVTSRLEEIERGSAERIEAATARANEVGVDLEQLAARLDAVECEREAAAAQLVRADEVWIQERDWVRRQLERLAAAHAEGTQAADGVGPVLVELTARLDGLEAGRDAVSSEVARVSQTLEAERAALHARLETLAAASAAAAPAGEPDRLLTDLAARLEELEGRGAAVASELVRATTFWAEEIGALGTRLDQVAATAADAAPREDGEPTALVAALTARLEAMESDRDALAAEVGRVSASWVSGGGALSSRLDEVSGQLAQVESVSRSAAAAATAAASASAARPQDDAVAELRTLVDGLRARVASGEQELAALAGSRDLGTQLDELHRRVESVERWNPTLAAPGDSGVSGDGRFRLELRALELRMEHAEAAARENREAVLVQLERLASRVEWRLQRLEGALEPEVEEESAGAQVVPIRGGADL